MKHLKNFKDILGEKTKKNEDLICSIRHAGHVINNTYRSVNDMLGEIKKSEEKSISNEDISDFTNDLKDYMKKAKKS